MTLTHAYLVTGPDAVDTKKMVRRLIKASAGEPKRLAGKLSFDDMASSEPKVDVEFDAALVKEFKAAR